MKFEWESIYNLQTSNFHYNTSRAQILGGWIVKDYNWNKGINETLSTSITFVPDANHEWVIS